MEAFAAMLSGGDRRSIGRADEVVTAVRSNPARFSELWTCLHHPDPLVRMRAADACEKATREDAGLLAKHKSSILNGSLGDGTAEMRWHLIAMASRLHLSEGEARLFFDALERMLAGDASRIVRVTALQTAADLAAHHPKLKARFDAMLEAALRSAIPSVRARARKLTDR